MSRAMTITDSVTLVTEECCSCGVLFAITAAHQRRLIDKHTSFYCPNGHSQSYTGKTDAQKERERAERLERQLANRDEDLRSERASHIATKGQLTKAKKRIAAGVCPCCKRSFQNLHRHMAGQHPKFAAEVSS